MGGINDRLITLRKACRLNQAQFAKVLGLSRSGVADIETGRRSVTDKHLLMLQYWESYNVNIDWLKTGRGEMFLSNETDTLESLRQEYNLTDHQFNFISNFLRLPPNEKDVIFNFLSSVFVNENETVESKIERSLDKYILNAAHERTDIEVTGDMRKHDDDIMQDDSKWE